MDRRESWTERRLRREAEAGGDDLSHVHQHQADEASDMYERERAESRLEDLAGEDAAPAPESDPDDVATPLDDVASPAPDLSSIPMAEGPSEPTVDPQEEDDEVPLDQMSGEAYRRAGGAPGVGRPEDDDAALERGYRPD